jgi:hypothetical protein
VLKSLALPAGIFVGARIDGINGAAASWVVVYAILYLVSTFYTCRVTERNIRDDLRLIVVPLLAGIAMLIVTRLLRVLLLAQLPPALLLGVETIAATVVFLGTVHLLAPADLGDARVLLRSLLWPDKAAGAGITS